MPENEQLTPEQMMETINQLKNDNEKLRTEFDSLKKAHDKDSESLQKARELNSQLLSQVSVPEAQKKPEPKEDTVEDFVGDTIKETMTKYKQKVS